MIPPIAVSGSQGTQGLTRPKLGWDQVEGEQNNGANLVIGGGRLG